MGGRFIPHGPRTSIGEKRWRAGEESNLQPLVSVFGLYDTRETLDMCAERASAAEQHKFRPRVLHSKGDSQGKTGQYVNEVSDQGVQGYP